MKSLKESLFDNDLVSKDLTLGDVYSLLKSSRGVMASGVPIGYMIDVSEIKKDFQPYSDSYRNMPDGLGSLISLIASQPVPTKEDIKNDYTWAKNLKDLLTKYVRRTWLTEWKTKVSVHISPYTSKNLLAIDLEYSNGDGLYEFIFEPKQ